MLRQVISGCAAGDGTYKTSVIMSSSAVAISIFIGSTDDGSDSVTTGQFGLRAVYWRRSRAGKAKGGRDSLAPPNRNDMML